MNAELRSFVFDLVPGEPAKMFPARGNFIFIDTADAKFELSLDGSSFVPEREGRMIHLTDEFNMLYLRADSLTSCSGIFIVGRGSGISHAGYGGGGGDGGTNMNTPLIQLPFGSPDELEAAPTANLPTSVIVHIASGAPPSVSHWQLRVWTSATAPVTDFASGLIAPNDFSTTNPRAWFQV